MSLKRLIPNKIPISLYIHLPWCEKKCPYCDFNIAINQSNGDEELLMKAIFYDIENSTELLHGRRFSSIYFGGGTPSLVSSKIIKKIINKLNFSLGVKKLYDVDNKFILSLLNDLKIYHINN